MYEVGDVLYFCDKVVHPSIVCRHRGQLQQVDMLEDGPSIGGIQQRANMKAFRCKNRALARLAADYAVAWADDSGWGASGTNGADLTPYASKGENGRYYGWQVQRASGETAAFEHDALYRAFKWAGRKEETLSKNKGFTCDVFVCACFHAAAVSLVYGGDLAKIRAKAQILGNGRADQKALQAERLEHLKSPKSGNEFEKSVLRTWSNAGFLPAQDPEFLSHWKSTMSGGASLPERLDHVFTGALLVDAKFTHGAQMMARMEADRDWWQQI